MTMLAALVGAVALMHDGATRVLRGGTNLGGGSGGGSRGGGKKGGAGPLLAILLVVWILSWILAPIITQILARIHERIHTTSRMASSGPAPPFFPPPREPPPLPPPRLVPPRSTRVAPSCIRATAPTSAASIVINRTSRFFTCPSSCATTAWSSSRLQRSSRPRVTAMCACSGSVPVANALGSGSSTIQIRGRGTPDRKS